MNKLLWFLPFLLVSVVASSQITFEKAYGDVDEEQAGDVVLVGMRGYAMVGSSQVNGNWYTNMCLVRLDIYGDTLWTKIYSGGAAGSMGESLTTTFDGGFALTGSYGTNSMDADVHIVRTDSIGDTLWTWTYGGINHDRGFDIAQMYDSGFVVTGWVEELNGTNTQVFYARVDKNGNTMWTRSFGGGNTDDMGISVIQTADSNIAVVGMTSSLGTGDGDVFLSMILPNGDTLWTRTYGGQGIQGGNSVVQTSDGGFYISGQTIYYDTIDSDWDVFLIRTNSNGDTLWTRTFGGLDEDMMLSGVQTLDSCFISAGKTDSYGWGGIGDVYVVKLDLSGNILWTKTYGGWDWDRGTSIRQCPDKGYVIGGDSRSFAKLGAGDLYLIKTDDDGELVSLPESDMERTASMNIFPNPATTLITLQLPPQFEQATKIEVYDRIGQLVLRMDYSAEVDVSVLPAGLYFVVVGNEEGERVTGKMIKE